MPTFIPQPWIKVLQRFQHNTGGEVMSCTYGIRCPTTIDATKAALAVSAADVDFRATWTSEIDSEVKFLPAWGYWLSSGSGLDPETDEFGLAVSSATAANASSVQSSFPPNVAVSIRKRTAFVGRRFRGRIYIPWAVSEAAADELGVLTSGKVTALQSKATSWIGLADVDTNYTGLWLLHEFTKGDTSATAPTRVTTADPGPVVVTQRRRLPRSA